MVNAKIIFKQALRYIILVLPGNPNKKMFFSFKTYTFKYDYFKIQERPSGKQVG